MKFVPRSLHGRLLALSLLATLSALVIAGIAIGGVLERFVTASLDDRLGDKLIALSSTVRKGGSIDRAYAARFDALRPTDTEWRVEAPGGTIGSARIGSVGGISEADDQQLGPIDGYATRPPHPFDRERRASHRDARPPDPRDGAHPFDTRLRDGRRVHGRWEIVPTDRGPARIAVAVSRDAIDRPLRAALAPLAWSLLALAAALALAIVVQLRIGLRPLNRLRTAVAAIRAGRAQALPDDQPAELAPLADELNALIAQNAAQLTAARGHVANLAHGLKTPLATLALAASAPGRDPDGALGAEIARIEAAIRHHLGRARTGAAGAPRAAILLAPAVEALAAALARIHAARDIAFTATMAPDLALALDPHDLDELLGNLLDNGWRWARRQLTLDAVRDGAMVRVTIRDDGPGILPERRAAALAPGRRLDESGDGHGFGLAITRELAELNGGNLILDDVPGGGLAAIVTLPAEGPPIAK